MVVGTAFGPVGAGLVVQKVAFDGFQENREGDGDCGSDKHDEMWLRDETSNFDTTL